MIPEIQAAICITGTAVTPDEVTNNMGILPTETWVIGDTIQQSRLTRKHNGWCISTKLEKSYNFELLINQLLQVLKPKLALMGDFCREKKLDVELTCIAYITDETPSFHINRETISMLAQLGAEVDFDCILTE